jgi:hypothetical protein
MGSGKFCEGKGMSKFIGRFLVVLAFGWAGSVSSQVSITGDDKVTVDGTDWAQVDLFTNLSWNDINAVCPAGVCVNSGTLNGYDMTGWAWASLGDINDLFNYYIGSEEMGPGRWIFSESGGIWGLTFAADGWRATQSSHSGDLATGGIVHTLAPPEFGGGDPLAVYALIGFEAGSIVLSYADTVVSPDVDSTSSGAWFYRPSQPGPIVDLIWSATTGTGIPGSSTIVAKAGDVLTLDVLVTPDLDPNDPYTMGLLSAALSVVWETDNLSVAGPADSSIVCPAPPNAFDGICNDSVDNLFSASSLSEDYSFYFEAQNVNEPGFFNGETMTLARAWLLVSVKGNYELNVIYEDAGNQPVDIVTIDSGTSVQLNSQPPATATIKPPGC